MIAHELTGNGPRRVIFLHDWFCDRSSWDGVQPFLDRSGFTYVFADLRGYGGSREIHGEYTLKEAASDVCALAKRLGWNRFALVGHSMTSIVVQRVAQLISDDVERLVVVTPAPPTGLPMPPKVIDANKTLALASPEEQFETLRTWWGDRLGERWIRHKIERWRATSNPMAVAKYVEMYGTTDGDAAPARVRAPVLAIECAHDAPHFRGEFLKQHLLPLYPGAKLESITDSGHYPMQETPPLLAAMIGRFLCMS